MTSTPDEVDQAIEEITSTSSENISSESSEEISQKSAKSKPMSFKERVEEAESDIDDVWSDKQYDEKYYDIQEETIDFG